MSKWNGHKFSVYESEEKTVLGLLDELGSQVNHNTDNLKNKTDLHGDHKGSWQGLSRPTLSEEGMRATVEKIIDEDLPSINEQLDNVTKGVGDIANLPTNDLQESFTNNELINLSRKTYTITRPLILTRKNIMKANNAKIIADYDNWVGNDYTAIKVVIDDLPTNPTYVLERLMREISSIEIIGKGADKVKATAISFESLVSINMTDAPNFSYTGVVKDIYIRNFDTAINLQECWNTNFYNIHIRNCRTGINIIGKTVNVFFDGIQASNFTTDYTITKTNTYGIYVNSKLDYKDGEGRPEGLIFNKCLIFGAMYDVYILRTLFAIFNDCILDGATKNAVHISTTSPQGVKFNNCYMFTSDTASGSCVVLINSTPDINTPISITNCEIVGIKNGTEYTKYGIYIPDGGVARQGCIFDGNRFVGLSRGIYFVMCPENSSICKNIGATNQELIFIQNRGSRTIIDGNKKIGSGPVIILYALKGIPSSTIDIRNNSSNDHFTYKKGVVTIKQGENIAPIPNGFYTTEIGLRSFTMVTPVTGFVNYKVHQNYNWSNAALELETPATRDIDFVYESKCITI